MKNYSTYYELFLEQLSSTGYSKAQGFDISLFDKMSETELKLAEEKLLNLLDQKDFTVIKPLLTINSEKGLKKILFIYNTVENNTEIYGEISLTLYEKTKDIQYLENFINAFLNNKNTSARRALVEGYLKLSFEFKDYNILLNIIEVEQDRVILKRAITGILNLLGICEDIYLSNSNSGCNSLVQDLVSLPKNLIINKLYQLKAGL